MVQSAKYWSLEWSKTLACHADNVVTPLDGGVIGKTRVQSQAESSLSLDENPGRRTII